MHDAILSLDVGTTVAKAVLFDLEGRELAVAEHSYPLLTPQPGWAELEPQAIETAVLRGIRDIVHPLDAPQRILAVALSTQGGSLIPVRSDGSPTYNAITWMDRRSTKIVSRWRELGDAEWIRSISGWTPEAGLPLSSIAWLRQHQPQQFAASQRFLSVNDYLAYRLTGRWVTNPSMAGEMLLTDRITGTWSSELCDLVAIQPDQLSEILPSEAIVGEIRPEIADRTGLPENTALVNGGQDHSCEALALGMASTGDLLLACGTAWVVNGVADSPDISRLPPTMSLNAHAVPGRWTVSQFLGGLGAGIEWWLTQCWQGGAPGTVGSRKALYSSFNAALDDTEPGCGGLLFFPLGSSLPGGFVGLRLDHNSADMGRAVLEGAAYEVRQTLESLGQAGLGVEKMWMIGGATRNPLWPQILADVTGIPMLLTQYQHGPALGAALLAGKGLGLYNEYPCWITAQPVEPNARQSQRYDLAFGAYRRMYQRLSA